MTAIRDALAEAKAGAVALFTWGVVAPAFPILNR